MGYDNSYARRRDVMQLSYAVSLHDRYTKNVLNVSKVVGVTLAVVPFLPLVLALVISTLAITTVVCVYRSRCRHKLLMKEALLACNADQRERFEYASLRKGCVHLTQKAMFQGLLALTFTYGLLASIAHLFF
jgi:hypothetical protein